MSRSLKDTVSSNSSDIVAEVNLCLNTPQMSGKILVIVEGDDDRIVYSGLFHKSAVRLYPVGGCGRFEEIQKNLYLKGHSMNQLRTGWQLLTAFRYIKRSVTRPMEAEPITLTTIRSLKFL